MIFTIYPYKWSVLLLMFITIGCSGLKLPKGIDEEPLQPITSIGTGELFAGNLQGNYVAFVKDGLQLYDLKQQKLLKLTNQRPLYLGWDNAGTQLAAGYENGENNSRLLIFDRFGQKILNTELAVNLTNLHWSTRGDLLVVGYALTHYSFGSNLTQTLYVITGNEQVPILLADTTIKTHTAKILEQTMRELLQSSFSLQGDELVYLRLHDPPEFPPFLQVVYRNWQVPNEKLLGRLDVLPVKLSLQENREQVAILDNKGRLSGFDLWDAAANKNGNITNYLEQTSPSGRYSFKKGNLYDNDVLLVSWSPQTQLQFLSKGQFLVATNDRIYLGDGLQSETWPQYNEKKWVLRRWLHHGLIRYDDYLQQSREMIP